MTTRSEILVQALTGVFPGKIVKLTKSLDEITIEIQPEDLLSIAKNLRDDSQFSFEQLADLCAVDYSQYGNNTWEGPRFAVVLHLLSFKNNWRLRLRTFARNDELPTLDSVIDIWPSANWYEREAFDLFGVIFTGHPDLRRILTDYGFIGHPFRKDFPQVGTVEMRYDPSQQRVVYEPVSIEHRSLSNRVIREDTYGK